MATSKMIMCIEMLESYLFGSDVQFHNAKPLYSKDDPEYKFFPKAKMPRLKISNVQYKDNMLELTIDGDDEILAEHPQVSVRISKEEKYWPDGDSKPFYFIERHTLKDSKTGEIIAGYKSEHDIEVEKIKSLTQKEK